MNAPSRYGWKARRVDEAYLTPPELAELAAELPRDLSPDVAGAMLAAGGMACERVGHIRESAFRTPKETLERLTKIGDSARATLRGLDALAHGSDLFNHLGAALFEMGLKGREAGELLARLERDLRPFAEACASAAGHIDLAKSEKPSGRAARWLARHLASEFQRQTGRLPPAGNETWFVRFCACAGRHVDLKVGKDHVNGALRDLKESATKDG